MAIPYRQILRMAGIKTNAIAGVTASAIDASYTTTPLTSTQLGSADFPFSAIKDALVSVLGRIIRTYASVPNHPFRAYNTSQTVGILHKGLIPSTDASLNPVVGVYGAIKDATDGELLTKMPVQIIQTIIENPDTQLKGNYYHYEIIDDRLHHTRPSGTGGAKIDVVTFSASQVLTDISNNLNAPIPDACLDMAWTGLISTLFIDDEFLGQAQMCGQYFENCLAEMKAGATSFAPAPVMTASQAPGIS
jgi:hypothetical protein